MKQIYHKDDLHVGFRYLNTAGNTIEILSIDYITGKIQESSPGWTNKYWSWVDDIVSLLNKRIYTVIEPSKKPLYEIY